MGTGRGLPVGMTRTRNRTVAAALLAALASVALACGPSRSVPVGTRRVFTTTHPDPPTTAPAPAPLPLDPARPLRVLLVGDSLMFDAVPAIEAAFAATGAAVVRSQPWLGSGLTKTDLFDWRARWPAWVAEFRPDLVVALIGAWDVPGGPRQSDRSPPPVAPAGWQAAYRGLVTEALSTLASTGAHVTWIGMPWTRTLASPA